MAAKGKSRKGIRAKKKRLLTKKRMYKAKIRK